MLYEKKLKEKFRDSFLIQNWKEKKRIWPKNLNIWWKVIKFTGKAKHLGKK